MKHEARLIWCDALEVVKDLFSNPMFANYMSYDPHKVTVGQEREYSEFFTGMRAFAIQVSHLQLCIRILCQHPVRHITGTITCRIDDCTDYSCFR